MGYRRHIVFQSRPPKSRPSPIGTGVQTVGVDFRATAGYVADPPGFTFNGGTGWEQPPTGARDRSQGVDPRLAGCVFVLNSTGDTATYRVTVSPGNYQVRAAFGDATHNQRQNVELLDGESVLHVVALDLATFAGQFLDATGVRRSAAAWPTQNAPLPVALRAGLFGVRIGLAQSGLGSSTIATLSLIPA